MGRVNMSTQPVQLPFELSSQIQAAHAAPHVLLILLNRPEAMNAMSMEMEAGLTRLLNWFQNNDDYWCVYRLLVNDAVPV